MRQRIGRVAVILLGAAGLANATPGCTHYLHPTPTLDLDQAAPLPLRAALVISPAFRERLDTYGGFGTMGFGNTWVSETGAGLTPALEQMARSVFRDVAVVSRIEDARGTDVRLIPEVVELRQMDERSGFWISFQLHAVAQDAAGRVRLDKIYRGEEEGSVGAAVLFGAFAAAAALTTPTERAMARAMRNLRYDLRQARWEPLQQPDQGPGAEPLPEVNQLTVRHDVVPPPIATARAEEPMILENVIIIMSDGTRLEVDEINIVADSVACGENSDLQKIDLHDVSSIDVQTETLAVEFGALGALVGGVGSAGLVLLNTKGLSSGSDDTAILIGSMVLWTVVGAVAGALVGYFGFESYETVFSEGQFIESVMVETAEPVKHEPETPQADQQPTTSPAAGPWGGE